MDVLLWRELVAHAGSAQQARTAVRDGEYRRVLRGAYVPAGLPDTAQLRARVLHRLLPEGVALSGRSAAWALGLDVAPADGSIDVTTERGKHLLARPGVRPHAAALPDSELVELPEGLLAVSAARAFVDVARREPLVEAVAFGDALLRAGVTTVDQMRASVRRAAGLRGVVAARRVVPHLEPRSESAGESRLRMRLVLAGFPRPEAQVDYYGLDGLHLGRVDLVLLGVALEYDGREQRLEKAVFGRDRRRQNALVDAGVELRRFTAEDVTALAAAALREEVRRAVAAAAGRFAPDVLRGHDTLRPPRRTPLPTRADVLRAAA